MKKVFATLILLCLLLAGCESLRFAPSEPQKQNAWLHNRTTAIAAQTARAEESSEKLRNLAQLSELQSRAFTSYYGLPKEFPQAETAEDVLARSQLAETALAESTERPDVFQLADSVFELAIGISALLGGVYGTRAVSYLKQAREKSQALQEIIKNNELFVDNADATAKSNFKQLQKQQSPTTKRIVTEIKS